MNTQELENLIRRYFDADTSLSEETLLRRELARPEASAPSADEARAVLGLFAAQRGRQSASSHRSRVWATAAGLALLIAAGVSFHTLNQTESRTQYIAYVNGTVITDSKHVLAMMNSDLADMRSASADVDDAIAADLEQISNAIHSTKQ
ncbi:MAG: hypothetical protein K2F77_04950 [Muribaculaceae bacterium]|nr:hypothetical protein [Muribaculaceae bacterium]